MLVGEPPPLLRREWPQRRVNTPRAVGICVREALDQVREAIHIRAPLGWSGDLVLGAAGSRPLGQGRCKAAHRARGVVESPRGGEATGISPSATDS